MTAPTYQPITTGHPRKNDIDYVSRKFFVYTLSDAAGDPVYVGRSQKVTERLKSYERTGVAWFRDVRSVSMDGPFTWDEAVAEERRQIKAKLPRANQMHMPRRVAS